MVGLFHYVFLALPILVGCYKNKSAERKVLMFIEKYAGISELDKKLGIKENDNAIS